MIYSRSTEYAIRALIHLTQVPEGKYARAKDIAEQEEMPPSFLRKILKHLARERLLSSRKGLAGGYALRVAPSEISLLNIVEALDGPTPKQITACNAEDCPDGLYCLMQAKHVGQEQEIFCRKATTIADLLRYLDTRQRTLANKAQRRTSA